MSDLFRDNLYKDVADPTTKIEQINGQLESNTQDVSVLKDSVKGHTNAKEIGKTRNEDQKNYVYPTRIQNPVLPDAPQVKNIPNKGVDIIGHWYNDFGNEATASSSSQANGAYLWYDWRWNFTNNVNYSPDRHPLLGWYAGDDPKTLDWQCYWLAEAGVNVVNIVDDVNTSTWSSPTSKRYWQYVLFNQVKNFKSLKYITWLKHTRTSAEVTAGADGVTVCNTQHDDAINNVISKYDNFYVYKTNGKRYPTVYTWDLELMRGIYDNYNGNTNLRTHLKALGASLQAKGYDGICLMARGFDLGAVWTQAHLDDLENNGVILLAAGYEEKYGTEASYSNSYENYAKNCVFPTQKHKVLNVLTSADSQAPHPSNWNLPGHTPELFKLVLQRAVNSAVANDNPDIVSIYNVAEWAEGGPGLQPNMQDGFGYLDAVRSVAVNANENIDLSKINFTKPVALKTTQYPTTGVNNAYTTLASVTPIAGTSLIELTQAQCTWDANFQATETVTLKIQANFSDGSNAFVEKPATSAGTVFLDTADLFTLRKHNTYITSIHVMAKTNLASSTVGKNVVILGYCR